MYKIRLHRQILYQFVTRSLKTMSLNPRKSGEFIVKNAKHLSIDVNGIQKLVKEASVIT